MDKNIFDLCMIIVMILVLGFTWLIVFLSIKFRDVNTHVERSLKESEYKLEVTIDKLKYKLDRIDVRLEAHSDRIDQAFIERLRKQ